jgi:HlyD family secretion protein
MKNPNAIRSGVSIAAILAIALLAVSCNRVDDDGSIRVSGNIEVDDARLAFKVPGLLVERAVSEGETVTQGQVVARLDDTEQIQQVEVQRAEVAAAAAALATVSAASSWPAAFQWESPPRWYRSPPSARKTSKRLT